MNIQTLPNIWWLIPAIGVAIVCWNFARSGKSNATKTFFRGVSVVSIVIGLLLANGISGILSQDANLCVGDDCWENRNDVLVWIGEVTQNIEMTDETLESVRNGAVSGFSLSEDGLLVITHGSVYNAQMELLVTFTDNIGELANNDGTIRSPMLLHTGAYIIAQSVGPSGGYEVVLTPPTNHCFGDECWKVINQNSDTTGDEFLLWIGDSLAQDVQQADAPETLAMIANDMPSVFAWPEEFQLQICWGTITNLQTGETVEIRGCPSEAGWWPLFNEGVYRVDHNVRQSGYRVTGVCYPQTWDDHPVCETRPAATLVPINLTPATMTFTPTNTFTPTRTFTPTFTPTNTVPPTLPATVASTSTTLPSAMQPTSSG